MGLAGDFQAQMMLDWLRQRRRLRDAINSEAAELVARLGAEQAFWYARAERRDRSRTDADRQRLDAIMHRIYATGNLHWPADTAGRYLDHRRTRRWQA